MGAAIGHPIELVIFDCDGVLIDSEVISTRATVQALAEIGYGISEAMALERFVGKSYTTIRGQIEADWGQALPASFDADLERMTFGVMKRELQPIPGIAPVLKQLRLPRCVASSSSLDWIRLGLERTGLIDDLAPHLFSASMVANGKPAPDIFLHAAREMGVRADRAVVVEDSLAGIQAGVAAGMTVIGFTGGSHIVDADHGQKLKAEGAGHIIDDMAVLPALLAVSA